MHWYAACSFFFLPFFSPKTWGAFTYARKLFLLPFLGLQCLTTSVAFLEVCAAVILTPWGYIVARGYTYFCCGYISKSLMDTLADMFLTDMQDAMQVRILGSLRECEDIPDIFHSWRIPVWQTLIKPSARCNYHCVSIYRLLQLLANNTARSSHKHTGWLSLASFQKWLLWV